MAKKKQNKSLFKQISEELKKVKWPNKREMLKFTSAVIIFIIIFGLYFFGLDALFTWLRGTLN